MKSAHLSFIASSLTLAWAYHPKPTEPESTGTCVAPAVCTPPTSAFSRVMPVQSRNQWGDSGGYCGSLSVQAIAMSYGAWISQDQVRKAAKAKICSEATGDPSHGYEISTLNIGGALDSLKLTHEAWDYKNSSTKGLPYKGYLQWLKAHLASGSPVVWFIMCKGDPHLACDQRWDHIEPVWGVFSNTSLEDPTPYPTDVLVHGSDYGATTTSAAPSLYRSFASLPDTIAMDGNCGKAQAGIGRNEFYPCISFEFNYGTAITGVVEEGDQKSIPVALAVDRFDEPDLNDGAPPAQLKALLTIGAGNLTASTGKLGPGSALGQLRVGAAYTIYRWDNYTTVPTQVTEYASSEYTNKYHFTATAPQHQFSDPNTILSSGTTYYRALHSP